MLAATAFALVLLAADAPPPIVIDGTFTDWAAAKPALRDAADNPAGPVDVGAVTVVDDPAFLDILVELGRSANLQRLDGRLMLVIDADGDASTGMTQYDLPGTDAVVVFTPADTRDETRPGAGVAVRLPGPEAESVSPYDWGIMFAPTYASDRAEIRLQRGAVLSGRGPLLVGDKAVFRFVVVDRSGTVRDTTDPVVHAFATPFAAPTPAVGGADPLARPAGTDVRVLSWNGELGAFFSRPEHFARVIKAANPDILCFQELKDDASAEKLTTWLNQHVPSEKPWTCVFGAGGGNLRTAVASRLPLKPVESFDRVTYRNASGAERDVRAALALVEVGGKQLLAASIHLKCCGSAGTKEDFQRIDEVEAMRHALRTVLDSGEAAGAVVCGDYNLVGSRTPLERLLLKTDADGGDLAVAEALQIDGRSNATWADTKQPFTAGRLDYLVYSDATLRETGGFVFDAADLAPDRLAALSLSASETADASDHLPLVIDLAWTAGVPSASGKARP